MRNESLFVHETVLKNEAIEGLAIQKDGVYVDCTLGGAGHSISIAKQLSEKGLLIGLDQDQYAIEAAKYRLAEMSCQIHIHKSNFKEITEVVSKLGHRKVNGILFDLGVSSPQLDQEERGFSYHHEAPLDMRMDQAQSLSAYDIINNWSAEELANVIYRYGEERFSRRIATQIIKHRQHKPLETTLQLVDVIKRAIPAEARRTGPHPARRTFQAIRIAVNDELNVFKQTLVEAIHLLKKQGRICVITFHSLEDRICKQIFQEYAKGCICPPDFPMCTCEREPTLQLITRKPIPPSKAEIEQNARARSAKLRIAEKII